MRDMSQRAAAAMTLGLLTDDLFGALMAAPTAAAPETEGRVSFADYVAAGRYLRAMDAEEDGSAPAHPRAH